MTEEYTNVIKLSDYQEDPESAENELSEEEKIFLREYFSGCSVKDSAEKAGIEFTEASRLMLRPDVQTVVTLRKSQSHAIDEVQKRESVDFLSTIQRLNPIDYVDNAGNWDMERMKAEGIPVKGFNVTYHTNGDVKNMSISFYDALKATELLAKLGGWFTPDKVELSGVVGGLTPEMLKQIDEEKVIDAEVLSESPDEEELAELLG